MARSSRTAPIRNCWPSLAPMPTCSGSRLPGIWICERLAPQERREWSLHGCVRGVFAQSLFRGCHLPPADWRSQDGMGEKRGNEAEGSFSETRESPFHGTDSASRAFWNLQSALPNKDEEQV